MYTRRRFDDELYLLSDRHLRKADRERLLKIAQRGQADTCTSVLQGLRRVVGAMFIALGMRLQHTNDATLPVPLLPNRVLTD